MEFREAKLRALSFTHANATEAERVAMVEKAAMEIQHDDS